MASSTSWDRTLAFDPALVAELVSSPDVNVNEDWSPDSTILPEPDRPGLLLRAEEDEVAGWFERRAEARSVERARSARREAAESAEAAAALRAACRDAVSETVSALAEGVSDLQINNKRLTEQFASTNSQCRLNSPRRRSPSILLHDVPVDPAKRLHWHGGSLATYDDLHGSLVVGEQGSKPHETGVVKFGPLVSYDYFGLVKGACDLKAGSGKDMRSEVDAATADIMAMMSTDYDREAYVNAVKELSTIARAGHDNLRGSRWFPRVSGSVAVTKRAIILGQAHALLDVALRQDKDGEARAEAAAASLRLEICDASPNQSTSAAVPHAIMLDEECVNQDGNRVRGFHDVLAPIVYAGLAAGCAEIRLKWANWGLRCTSAFRDGLRSKRCSVRSVALSETFIEDGMLVDILASVDEKCELELLDLSSNNLGARDVHAILAAVMRCRPLRTVVLYDSVLMDDKLSGPGATRRRSQSIRGNLTVLSRLLAVRGGKLYTDCPILADESNVSDRALLEIAALMPEEPPKVLTSAPTDTWSIEDIPTTIMIEEMVLRGWNEKNNSREAEGEA